MSICVKIHIFVTKKNIMNKVKLPLLTFLAIPLTLFAGPRSFQQAKKLQKDMLQNMASSKIILK